MDRPRIRRRPSLHPHAARRPLRGDGGTAAPRRRAARALPSPAVTASASRREVRARVADRETKWARRWRGATDGPDGLNCRAFALPGVVTVAAPAEPAPIHGLPLRGTTGL